MTHSLSSPADTSLAPMMPVTRRKMKRRYQLFSQYMSVMCDVCLCDVFLSSEQCVPCLQDRCPLQCCVLCCSVLCLPDRCPLQNQNSAGTRCSLRDSPLSPLLHARPGVRPDPGCASHWASVMPKKIKSLTQTDDLLDPGQGNFGLLLFYLIFTCSDSD